MLYNQNVLKIFENEVVSNKISASYLFYGDKRVNLLLYAKKFSKLILSQELTGDVKSQVINQIEKEQHPDLEIINKNNEGIKINEVRDIILSAIEKPYSSNKKIFILNGIETIRKESSNALLKIIEEPPKDIYFILLSKTLNILSTIKSRAIKINIKALNHEDLDVSEEVYTFFDGNMESIEKWKENQIDINHEIKSIKEIKDNIQNYEVYLTLSELLEKLFSNNSELNSESFSKTDFKILKESIDILGKEYEIELFQKMEKLKQKDVTKGDIKDIIDEIEKISIMILIRYNETINYIVENRNFLTYTEWIMIVNDVEEIYSQNRQKLNNFLSYMILKIKNDDNLLKMKYLIEIKNSLKNNVNIRSVIFNFFNIVKN